MAVFTITLERQTEKDAEDAMGVKKITFEVPENMYGMIGDILTGRLKVEVPKKEEEAPAEEKPAETQ